MNRLPPSFFDRPTLEVARDLIGCFLVRQKGKTAVRALITEVEAYDGPDDLACHASKGRTDRTETLFGEAGYFYVYLVYGMHWMLNIVTGPKDYPAAVLIRGIEGTYGPARLTKRLDIDGKFNKIRAGVESGLWFEPRNAQIRDKMVTRNRRIGVAYAGPVWSNKKYRYTLKDWK